MSRSASDHSVFGGSEGSERASEVFPELSEQPAGNAAKLRAAVLYGGIVVFSLAAPRISRRLKRRLGTGGADALTLAGLTLFGWGVINVMERKAPFRKDWNQSSGDVQTDLSDLLVSDVLARGVAEAAITPIRTALAGNPPAAGPIHKLPLPVRLTALLLLFDLGHYTMHRYMHEVSGWRFHSAHHSPTRIYSGNATRFHPVEVFIDGTQELLLLAMVRPDSEMLLAYQVFRGIYGQIQHGNIDMDSGPLNYVMSTPERHRWHHSEDPLEGNKNYGALVSVWDSLLGSSFTPARDFDATIGNGDAEYPTAWSQQLAEPFRKDSTDTFA